MATTEPVDCNCTGLALKVAIARDRHSIPFTTQAAVNALAATYPAGTLTDIGTVVVADRAFALEALAELEIPPSTRLLDSFLEWPDAVVVIAHATVACTCGRTKGRG